MSQWDAERHARLQLHLVAGVGPRTQQCLLEHFGSASSALAATQGELQQVPRVGLKLAERIVAAAHEDAALPVLEVCRESAVQVLLHGDDGYPSPLSHIPDPPGALFVRGGWMEADALSVAIVGSRHATRYGLNQAERLGRGLALAGLTIVSGLARGIDAAAHRGALAVAGRTLAVLGSGVLRIYPPEHGELGDAIAASGALLSEAPPLRKPMSGAFPQRNRLISGVSLGTIVVEAADRSGALITARHAMEQGREVFAVPGRVDSRLSRGCHQLLRDGAKLVEHVDDVLEELCPLAAPVRQPDSEHTVHHARELKLDERERKVLDHIGAEPTHPDTIAAECQLPIHHVLATISVLESRRLIHRTSGSTVARC
ncbi:MAG: DNA-processing protein DprA [Planctomycetales bacterium]|nr:DNA-processing protein DprA [Planctomycetales bacterium]